MRSCLDWGFHNPYLGARGGQGKGDAATKRNPSQDIRGLLHGESSQTVLHIGTAMGCCSPSLQAFLRILWCEDGQSGFIDPDGFRMLQTDLAFAKPAGGQHPATSPLDAPIEDFLGNHDCQSV